MKLSAIIEWISLEVDTFGFELQKKNEKKVEHFVPFLFNIFPARDNVFNYLFLVVNRILNVLYCYADDINGVEIIIDRAKMLELNIIL